ncbi:MAG: hypothetical protein LBH25_05130 [Fibromonadaceae bacterium]|jgi:hypothetical protein|nr:hypothetical protein [Fibromonadaceae bacterium]
MKKLKIIFTRQFKKLIYQSFTTPSEVTEQPQAGKCLLYLFFICIAAGIASYFCTGCMHCEDCTYKEEKLPAYANKSGAIVKIVAIDYNGYVHSYAKLIDIDDTLHSSYYFREKPEEWSIPNDWNCGIASIRDCPNPTRIELHFLDGPEKCLIFDGPIEHDGIDMRSWDSYKKGNKIDDWADFWAGVEYVYTITPEHRDMAKEEDCQSSASE